jgi:hypothetical protein
MEGKRLPPSDPADRSETQTANDMAGDPSQVANARAARLRAKAAELRKHASSLAASDQLGATLPQVADTYVQVALAEEMASKPPDPFG